ncbi:MAG: hypothetical protein ACYSR5_11365 [Planctomycetota bacterium]|jgi:hypothetical protein
MISTVARFESSGAINITETVYQTARRTKGTFHVETVAFAIEVQGITIAERASTKEDVEVIGKNQIAQRLSDIAKYDGRLVKLGSGWYAWS